ncbi:MAG TPA: carboxypeptidase regulatory-like domain-containing protein [Candidatus Acidoferrales bacterium]|nr:carboxypeptidase regulatory-like domain-containing protein [Candidatus Acidoferrales bacterium]
MMRPRFRHFLFIAAVLLIFGASRPAWAQYNAGIQGTVTDNSGAAVPNAKVTVTNQATNVSTQTATSATGFYQVGQLPPGNYTVTVEVTGFQKSQTSDVVVLAEQIRGLNVALQVGQVSQTVTVNGSVAPLLQTEDASVSKTLSGDTIEALPAAGRDPFELIRLTPGVFGDSARTGVGQASNLPSQEGPGGSNSQIFQIENQVQVVSDGQRVSANNYLLDGVSINSLEWGGAVVLTPNEESVHEVVVTSSDYDAADGRNSGAITKVDSKYGTDKFHGSGLFKLDNAGFNAFNKYNGPFGKPQRNNENLRQFGGSIGGPIIHNNLFFFFSYEGARVNNTHEDLNVLVETPEFRQYVIAQRPNSIAAKLFATPGIEPRTTATISTVDCCSLSQPAGFYYCCTSNPGTGDTGGGPDGIPDFAKINTMVPNTSSANQYNGRLDYHHGSDQFFGSFYVTHTNSFQGGDRPLEDLSTIPTNTVATIAWTHPINSSMVNEARGNFTRWYFNQVASSAGTDFGVPQYNVFDFGSGLGCCLTLGVPAAGTTPGIFAQNTYEFRDTLSKVWNNHSISTGVQIRKEQDNNTENGTARPNYQFESLLNFASDQAQREAVTVDPTTGAQANDSRGFRTSDYSLFVQDNWKVRPNLVLNLGLRWEYFSPLSDTQKRLSNFIPSATGLDGVVNGKVVTSPDLYHSSRHDFGPRIGLAWSPSRFNDKIVVRSGFGIAYNRVYDAILSPVRQNTPFEAAAVLCCSSPIITPSSLGIQYSLGASNSPFSFPANPNLAFGIDSNTGGLCANAACTSDTPVDEFAAPHNLPNAYVYLYSTGIQWAFSKNEVFSIGYSGSSSHRLIRLEDLNRFFPGDTFDDNLDLVQNDGSNGQPCGAANPTCSAPHPTGNINFKRIFMAMPDVNANYNALIVSLTHRFAYGFELSGTYTYGKSIDTESFELGLQQLALMDQRLDRGPSDYDITHNINIAGIWNLPIFRGRNDFLGYTLGGWGISGVFSWHTGFPWTPILFGPANNDPNGDGFRPDYPPSYNGTCIHDPSNNDFMNGVCPTTNTRGTSPTDPNFNFLTTCPNVDTCDTVAFPRGGGSIGRNTFRGPHYHDVDFSLTKTFGIPETPVLGEHAGLEFRANMFNAFNFLNPTPFGFSTSNTDLSNAFAFGRTSGALSGRVLEFQLRLFF